MASSSAILLAISFSKGIKSHDDCWHVDVGLDRLMRQNTATVYVNLVADRHIISQNGDILQASPAADGAVPSDDGGFDPGMVLDLGATEENTALKTHAIADHDVGANSDIGSYSAVLSNLGRGVDQHVTTVHVGLGRRSEVLAALLGEGRKIEAGSAKEVLGLANIHPEALQVKRVELVVLDHGREGLLLNRCWAELNALQNRGVEDVHASVDAIADELNGLLDEAIDARRMVGLVNHYTVL